MGLIGGDFQADRPSRGAVENAVDAARCAGAGAAGRKILNDLARCVGQFRAVLLRAGGIEPIVTQHAALSAKLRGHYQYYGVSGNYRAINSYYRLTLALVRKWLNRRSQKRSMSWEKFNDYLSHYPLPKPSIRHNFYTGYPCDVR